MSEYQVIARKFRPQRFCDVVGQEEIVRTLLNAISMKRVAHAYLFCGSKGTGKTTIARILAKALNCYHPDSSFEPCNTCSSCKEIAASHSLDVIEIDGATHRGIEDVRQISETAHYAPTSSKYKIYLIDEVHMLTKEAFNALLKLLEEPGSHIKFFFATTEPHKLPATILSRCQRFNLSRIPVKKIEEKLAQIGAEIGVKAEEKALHLIAKHSEGALRDAEVLFDQMISFFGNDITSASVEKLLGLLPEEKFFAFDEAIVAKDFSKAIAIAQEIVARGYNCEAFIEEMTLHYRTILLLKRGIELETVVEKERYKFATQHFSEPTILAILNLLFEAAQGVRFAFSQSTYLEMLLVNIVQCFHKPSLEVLVERLITLEQKLGSPSQEVKKEEVSMPPPPVTNDAKQKARHDTIVRFAAKELKGSLKQGDK